jgi:hypothetical protein
MNRIKGKLGRGPLDSEPLPCEYFDLIGGTSTGGYARVGPSYSPNPINLLYRLVALLLGRLRLCSDCAIDAYLRFAEYVFTTKKLCWKDGTFKASRLQEAIVEQVEFALGAGKANASLMDRNDPYPICKAYVNIWKGAGAVMLTQILQNRFRCRRPRYRLASRPDALQDLRCCKKQGAQLHHMGSSSCYQCRPYLLQAHRDWSFWSQSRIL